MEDVEPHVVGIFQILNEIHETPITAIVCNVSSSKIFTTAHKNPANRRNDTKFFICFWELGEMFVVFTVKAPVDDLRQRVDFLVKWLPCMMCFAFLLCIFAYFHK